jgi:hypothetical protein
LVPVDKGYQFAIWFDPGSSGAVDHCDMWGWGNAIAWGSTTTAGPYVIANNWIHDACWGSTSDGSFHTDGPGFEAGNNNPPPKNITIRGNTIASVGNTNGIAFQPRVNPVYSNITIDENYLSGFGATLALDGGQATYGINLIVTNNIFSTDIASGYSLYGFAAGANLWRKSVCPTNLWRNNKFKVYPGTAPISRDASWVMQWNYSNDGNYLWPDRNTGGTGTLHMADWPY